MVSKKSLLPYIYKPQTILLIIIPLIILVYAFDYLEIRKNVIVMPTTQQSKNLKYDVFTSKCRIPFMEPFDESILEYIKHEIIVCENNTQYVSSNETHLIVQKHLFKDYNIQVINCSYQYLWRVNPNEQQLDIMVKYGEGHFFNDSVRINQEYLRLICFNNSVEFYRDFHSFVPTENKVVKQESKKTKESLNVLVLGLDSLSRLNFHRQMPLTLNYLVKNLSAIEFFGYNKVGDNTYPNLLPVLTGLNDTELEASCDTKNRFDNCSFIWEAFNKSGYATSYAEDASWMGLFNNGKRGFLNQPTTHYWASYSRQAEDSIGNNRRLNAKLCLGNRTVYSSLLEYVERSIKAYNKIDHKFFGFFWGCSLTHDFLNLPSVGDTTHKEFFERITPELENTALFFISDHGIRWGDILSVHQGRMEERLPCLYVVLPRWFKDKYPEAISNMMDNTRKLTTHFDLHETMKSFLETNISSNPLPKRGISLFRPIPEDRSCFSAGIPAHWCTCQENKPVSVENKIVTDIVNFTVDFLNAKLSNYSQCEKLSLSQISDATVAESSFVISSKRTVKHYTVNFQTKPGGALFESTVMCDDCAQTSNYKIAGSVSRHNLYGSQSYCVSDAKLKLYCYCRN